MSRHLWPGTSPGSAAGVPAGGSAPAVPGESGAAARRLVETLGGRFSTEAGIDVDRRPDEIERWFLLASLFGNPIPAGTVMRTHRALAAAGIRTVADVSRVTWDELVALLDQGGYVRYDFRTASRLQALASAVDERCGGRISVLVEAPADPAVVEAALDRLPGWGPTTVRIFLRELRGRWPGAQVPLDERARWGAWHLGLGPPADPVEGLAWLDALAGLAGVDPRDLEAALIRLALGHRRGRQSCPGRSDCLSWRAAGTRQEPARLP